MRILLIAAVAVIVSASANAGEDYKECSPAYVSGRIAAREFEPANAIRMKGFVIEERSGDRSYVNVDMPEVEDVGHADYGRIVQSVNSTIRVGAKVRLKIFECAHTLIFRAKTI